MDKLRARCLQCGFEAWVDSADQLKGWRETEGGVRCPTCVADTLTAEPPSITTRTARRGPP